MAYSDGKKIVRNKHIKKIGIIVASVAVAAIAVVVAFALIKRGSSSDFTIRFDNTNVVNHTSMSPTLDGEPSLLLIGDPITQTKPTKASAVEAYLDSLVTSEDGIGGSQNMPDDEEGYEDAIVYTVYLSNDSSTETQKLYYELKLEHYSSPTNGADDPLSYMRCVVQTSTVANGNINDSNLSTTYFGSEHVKDSYGTVVDPEDMRECISSFKKVPFASDNPLTVRQPTYIGLSEDGYCHNFINEENNEDLILESIELAPLEIKRFTFVTYFEGSDPDCNGQAPDEATFLMSLHFGVK